MVKTSQTNQPSPRSAYDAATTPADVLNQSQLFAGIPERDRHLIAGTAIPVEADRELITHAGDPASHLFLLRSGRVKYYRLAKSGQELVLWWLSPGDVFGLASFLKGQAHYLGSAQAVTRCQLLSWKDSSMRELATAYPNLSENALRITLHYLSVYANRHEALLTHTAAQRLAHALVDLGDHIGTPQHGHLEVEITNEQLGKLADVGLFTATRVLSAWEKQGAVVKKRGKILIEDPEKLPID